HRVAGWSLPPEAQGQFQYQLVEHKYPNPNLAIPGSKLPDISLLGLSKRSMEKLGLWEHPIAELQLGPQSDYRNNLNAGHKYYYTTHHHFLFARSPNTPHL